MMKRFTPATSVSRVIDGRVRRVPRQTAAFTLVEIALCLAIVGFAMVAIVGVLPTGMTVQKENREETLITQDGLYLLEAIRSGSRGINDLTNYVERVVISSQLFHGDGRTASTKRDFVYSPLTNGHQVVALLTTPKIRFLANNMIESNVVEAHVLSINGVAAEKSTRNANVRDFAFRYRVRSEVVPFQSLVFNTNDLRPVDLAANLYDVRLTLAWPLFERQDGWQVGSERRVFRTLMAGSIDRVPTNQIFQPRTYTSRY